MTTQERPATDSAETVAPGTEMSRLLDRLRLQELDLTPISTEMGLHFLSFSGRLGELIESGQRLGEEELRLATLMNPLAGETPPIEEAREILRAPLEFLESAGQAMGEHTELLCEAASRAESIFAAEGEIEEALAAVDGPDTEGRATLAREIEAALGAQFQALQGAHRVLRPMLMLVQEYTAQGKGRSSERRGQMAVALAALAARIGAHADSHVDGAGASQTIANEAVQVLIGIQSHDLVTQRLEHVSQALESLDQFGNEWQAAGRTPEDPNLFLICQTSRLELAQLSGIRDELKNAHAVLEQGVRNILEQVGAPGQDSSVFARLEREDAEAAAIIAGHIEASEQVRALVGASVTGAERFLSAMRPITDLTLRLHRSVQAMPRRLEEACPVAGPTVDRVREGLQAMACESAQFAQSLQKVTQGVKTLLDEGMQQRRHLDGAGRSVERRLHSLRESSAGALRAIRESIQTARDIATEMHQTLDFIDCTGSRIAAIQDTLEELAATATTLLGDGGAADNEQLRWLLDRYTMTSERGLHAAVLGLEDVGMDGLERGAVELF